MAVVAFNVKCYATYSSSLEVPDEIAEDEDRLKEYIADNIGDVEMQDLMFLEDLQKDELLEEIVLTDR